MQYSCAECACGVLGVHGCMGSGHSVCNETMSLYVSSENQPVTENMFGHVLITEVTTYRQCQP